ncbi:MAG TPA: hypothetical protein VKC56_00075 [Gallionellaceae bacterium]|nr:hypothetical protein [Gallionellaceae bacterium]
MTEELPGGGTDQLPAASQAAASHATVESAAPGPEAAALYEAAPQASQQQAYPDENPALQDQRDEAAEAGEVPEATENTAQHGAPEHYAFQPVEGVHFSDDVLGSFSEVARELDLSQDAAQHVLDRVAPAIARQQQAALQAVNAQWVSQVKADHEIGGDRLQQNLAIAKKARDAFGTDGLRTLLNESRIGNHPEMIRFFVRAGQAISEDSFVPGGTRPPSGGKDAATVLYGKQS